MSESRLDIVSEPEMQREVPQEMPHSDTTVTEVEQLRAEAAEANNARLRALADLENYRTRSNRQTAEERKYASIEFMRELLPVWDNIGRALEAAADTHNLETLVKGVEMVHQQFLDVLKKYHCEPIEAKEQPFDPHCHESVAQISSADHPANTVIEEVQKGFRLFDRVVRPSQVVLASKAD